MARHPVSLDKAKKELKELADEIRAANDMTTGGGFFVSLVADQPFYRALTFFIRAENRKQVVVKLNEYDEAHEFLEKMEKTSVSISGAGLQPACRAEGICRDIDERYERGRNAT